VEIARGKDGFVEFIGYIVDFVLHIDEHLDVIIQNAGPWSYLLLFGIIFSETGFVVTPFLPGDSLLFAVGAFAALGSFDILILYVTLVSAATLGNMANYAIGRTFGVKIFKHGGAGFLKKEYMDKTHRFYEKYGAKTIVIARFVPIVRTFAPFVAGIGKMSYRRFMVYNVVGSLLWVTFFVLGGFYFGNAPIVKDNFTVTVLIIIFISVLPVIIEIWRHRRKSVKRRA